MTYRPGRKSRGYARVYKGSTEGVGWSTTEESARLVVDVPFLLYIEKNRFCTTAGSGAAGARVFQQFDQDISVSGTPVSNFITAVILGPFAGAVFGALLSGTFVVKVRPTDPGTKVRTEPPTLIIWSILVSTGAQNSKTSKGDDAWVLLVGGLMLLVLGVFLYACYAMTLWCVVQTCAAVCIGLALPIVLIAAANRGDPRQAAAWWTLTGSSLAIGAIGALFAPGFALSRMPEWLLKAAATAPGAGGTQYSEFAKGLQLRKSPTQSTAGCFGYLHSEVMV